MRNKEKLPVGIAKRARNEAKTKMQIIQSVTLVTDGPEIGLYVF